MLALFSSPLALALPPERSLSFGRSTIHGELSLLLPDTTPIFLCEHLSRFTYHILVTI